jgi:hypothetical protein
MYSKNGSIPKLDTDGTEGWIEVPDAPEAPEGKEVVWCFPPGWVVRDIMPIEREGYRWAYYLDKGWIEHTVQSEQIPALTTDQIQSLDSSQLNSLTSQDISSL